METRQVGFMIPNKHCKWHEEPLGCVFDSDNYHTCCKEECELMDVLFGKTESRHMKLSKPDTDASSRMGEKVKGKVGYWICECGKQNRSMCKFCAKCFKEKPSDHEQGISDEGVE